VDKKKQTKWLAPNVSKGGIREFAKTSEETFEVGERKQPVYIPGASTLDGGQLDEILHDQTEKADAEAKATAVHTPSKREDRDELAERTRSYKDWQSEVAKRGTKRKYYGGFG